MLQACTARRQGGAVQPLDAADRERLQAWFELPGSSGLRLLALATRELPARAGYGIADEDQMCLEGFLLFLDPPKAQARATLQQLAARGIHIKIVTGDNRHVAAHLARSVGLDAAALLTGRRSGR